MVEVRILGSLELRVADRPVTVAERPAVVLAVLAAHSGQVVARERLIDAIWETDPPNTAGAQVTMHVSTLRKACGDTRVVHTTGSGYRLEPALVRVDAHEAEALIAAARATADPGRFRAAALLWRGPVLTELPGAVVAAIARRLDDLRLAVLEEWAAAASDSTGELLGQLGRALAEHPLREPLRARLMEHLWRAGSKAEALTVYRDGREALRRELGLEPGTELRELQERILRDDAPPTRDRAGYRLRPAQLPPSISAFTGRDVELAGLDRMLAASGAHLRIAVVSGIAGVGKTTLAVHWAHRIVERFPDGQLFADLRGYDDRAEPAGPDEVLERFLPALGVPADQLPTGLEDRAAMFRSALRDSKVLILLDNAASTEQVRPLLPGHSGCTVVVTSRPHLDGLVARHGAVAVPMEGFDRQESADLLTQVIGPDRVAQEPDAASRLAELCGGLPLALRIAAARVAGRPAWSLGRFARRLAVDGARLDQLSGEGVQLRRSFELSYRHLPTTSARAFRRLGLLDTPAGISAWMLAALLDEPDVGVAEELLEELVDAQLLQQLGPDVTGRARYRFHDLIRLYARERAEQDEAVDELHAASRRSDGALLALTELAGRGFRGRGGLEEVHGDAPRWLPAHSAELLTEPLEWLDAERLNITAAVRRAARAGNSELCWDLAVSSSILHRRRGYLDDQQAKYESALELCRRTGDLRGEAALLVMHNDFHVRRGEVEAAGRATRRAADLFGRIGDRRAEALATTEYAIVKRILGEWGPALAACEDASAYFTSSGDDASAAYVHYHLGIVHLGREQPADAGRAAERGLAIVPADAREVVLHLRLLLAESHLQQGRHGAGLEVLDTVLRAAHARGDRRMEVQARLLTGAARLATGAPELGMTELRDAYELARRLGDRLLEGRALLSMGRADPVRYADRLAAAARIFAHQGHRVWHAETLAAMPVADPGI